ncbi:uncharacterized protein F4812DRAFT_463008 [Daldinia caldariorum]|uniref:uncharacterized protein n=1 Tax=Daldinia caldariorum TaxID=326644 RepID=UPI002008C74C|nr:uncharacterized protein F4812DRAFT_463008 [Daldinia caldariorum]KAI1464256.1 hypothetical protein F4812DRAFT_463008 [Daldinia caldariorum]
MPSYSISKAISLTLVAASAVVDAHSWVEYVRKIDSTGAFIGSPGFPYAYMNRSALGFTDDMVQNKILDTKSNPPVCKPKANAYDKLDRLTAAPGDYVALLYQENGHVTQPDITPRPYRDGLVSVYGTLHHEDSDGINDVLGAWTADGKGGNGKGKLLGTHFYDDGQCYQNAGHNFAIPIYASRYKEHGLEELYCQTDFQLPEDLPHEGTYTVMWVWDWPLITSDTTNVTEIYTSCAEIQLQAPKSGKSQVKFSENHPIDKAAIKSQLNIQFEATGLGVGTHPPAAPTETPATSADNGSPTSEPETTVGTSTSKKHHKGVKTVTVTAPAMTTTEWQTVTISAGGAGNTGYSESYATINPAPTQNATTSAQKVAPTSIIPVTSVSKFLKARATGQARRNNYYA